MDIYQKAKIVVQFTEELRETNEYTDFFEYHDLGVPFAIGLLNEMISISEKGEELIEETFNHICDEYGVDRNSDYEDLEDLIYGADN